VTAALTVGRRDRRTLAIGIVVCGSIVGAGRGVPLLRAWETTRLAAAVEAERRLAVASTAAGMAASIEGGADRARHQATAASSALISGATPAAAAATLAVFLSGRADSTGVTLTSESVKADTGFTYGFARARVRLAASADVRGLTRFLARIEASAHVLAVREMTVSQTDPGAADDRPESLRIELVVEALVRRTTTEEVAR
jgi:type II secretion system (T2SS) protein M